MHKNILVQLEELAQVIPAPIYWLDTNNTLLGANDASLKMIGVKKLSDILGKKAYDVYPHSMAEHIISHDKKVIESGQTLAQEEMTKSVTTGEIGYVISVKTPLRDENGEIIGIIGTSIDITDTKKREALEKQQIILEEKIKGLQLMGGAIAHELRSPLEHIYTCSSIFESNLPVLLKVYDLAVKNGLIKNDVNLVEATKAALDKLNNSIVIANVFTNTILANLEKIVIPYDRLDRSAIKFCIENTLTLLPFRDPQNKKFFDIKIKDDFEFKSYHMLMQQVLATIFKRNLKNIHNAGSKGKIKMWTEITPDWNILHINDTGYGVDQEELDNIFEIFFGPSPSGVGVEVGLAYSRLVITQFNGQLLGESTEGGNTHFTLKLPKMPIMKPVINKNQRKNA